MAEFDLRGRASVSAPVLRRTIRRDGPRLSAGASSRGQIPQLRDRCLYRERMNFKALIPDRESRDHHKTYLLASGIVCRTPGPFLFYEADQKLI